LRNLFNPDLELTLPPLWAWQERTVPLIREAVKQGHRRIVVQSPTGAGKTLLAAHLFANSISKGKRPMFTVPDITLVDQTVKSFERVGITDIGVIQAQHERTDFSAQVQIASVQTLIRRELPEVDFVIVDESHVQYEGLYKILDGPVWADKIIIGLSATPWARGMGLHWSKLIVGATIKELIEEKVLCGFYGFGPTEDLDRGKLHIKAGEFDEGESSLAMREAKIVADVVATWQQRWNKDRTFMFCVDRAHAKEQQAKFEQAGIPFGYIDGTMPMEWRKAVFEAFRDGRIKGIASVGCLSRGVDEDVHCIIDAQPTNSEMAYVQKIGRGLRNPGGGDKRLLILDHAGNCDLGMVTDIHHESLDSRKPGDKEPAFKGETKAPKPRKCPHCNALVPYGQAKCFNCATVLPAKSRHQHEDGELIEFGSNGHRKTAKHKATMAEKQDFYSGFLGLALERGKKQGWAAHRYKEKFGVWPNQLQKVAVTPSREVLSFDKHCRIKFAKSQQKPAPEVEAYAGEF
jgi:superfamily II DNA or RNA helicase